ncbi:hypothetical protein J2T13_002118 [Paenibacillus sp. DS2015]|uniref:cyclic GMP-AMP synthase DncV-like nucleotidyltransferase n=1 Tax=Paenibacillus sp. DS2015 TaxID=3373917 RepID=UPI003D191586
MHNLDSNFNTFYSEHVVLFDDEKENLIEKKDLNIDRLESGIVEYNAEKKTDFELIDHVVQGSMAMETVVQNEENEYDIDVAIIFDKDNLPDGMIATKNMVVDALKRKCKQFKTEPEALTNCIRIEYADGYHIDFAIYRKFIDSNGYISYEHCGSEWRSRDPEAISDWFNNVNNTSNQDVQKVVSLLKMFCKSRTGWSMPGGLIQSVLVAECIQSKDRLDETFYYTIQKIRDRLEDNKSIQNPTDSSLSLLYTDKDEQKVKNLHTRLTNQIKKLDYVLFKDDCTDEQAVSTWKEFFRHDYWGDLITESVDQVMVSKSYSAYNDVEIMVNVEWIPGTLIPLSGIKGRIPKDKSITFTAKPNFNNYTEIEWEVINYGDEFGTDRGHTSKGISVTEHTCYRGNHSMICRVFNQGTLVCEKEVKVPIK